MSILNKLGAAAIGAVSAVALARGGAGGRAQAAGGTLIVANEAELGELDPHITCATSSARWVMNHVAEPLMQQDMTDDENIPPPLIPGLAQSWEVSADGKVYTFHLKEGVKFHDGTDFTADDMVFNVYRQFDQTTVGGGKGKRAAVLRGRGGGRGMALGYRRAGSCRGGSTITRSASISPIRSTRSCACSPRPTAGRWAIISPESVEKYGNDRGPGEHGRNRPVQVRRAGSGRLHDPRAVRRILERRVEGPGRPAWSSWSCPTWRPRQAALRAGEAHIVIAPEPDSLSKLEEEGFVVSKGPMPHIWTVSFNEHEEAFADERVRMAVHHAMDREGMAHQLLQGTALPGESWLSRTSEAYKASDRWHAYDPARARALLEEAGALGTKLVFATSTSGSGQMQPGEDGRVDPAQPQRCGLRRRNRVDGMERLYREVFRRLRFRVVAGPDVLGAGRRPTGWTCS